MCTRVLWDRMTKFGRHCRLRNDRPNNILRTDLVRNTLLVLIYQEMCMGSHQARQGRNQQNMQWNSSHNTRPQMDTYIPRFLFGTRPAFGTHGILCRLADTWAKAAHCKPCLYTTCQPLLRVCTLHDGIHVMLGIGQEWSRAFHTIHPHTHNHPDSRFCLVCIGVNCWCNRVGATWLKQARWYNPPRGIEIAQISSSHMLQNLCSRVPNSNNTIDRAFFHHSHFARIKVKVL